MREVHASDIVAVARMLLSVPPFARDRVCAEVMIHADCADKFTKRLGRPHRTWGNGTLLAAVQAHKRQAERSFSDVEFTACYQTALECLSRHRAAKACKLRLHTHIKI
jgi:hypothetical protein